MSWHFLKKSLDFLVFLYYNQLTNRHEFQQWTGQSRGFAYDDKGEYDRAIEDYNKAIELNPEFAEVYNSRGLAYFIQKFPTTACGDFYQAEEYYI